MICDRWRNTIHEYQEGQMSSTHYDLSNLRTQAKEEALELFPNNTILIGFRGSVSHGTYRPTEGSIDDIDLIGIHVGPIEHYLGFRRKSQETIDRSRGKWDIVSYEIRHYVSLLKKNNPNVMQLLWLPNEMIVRDSEQAKTLRDSRVFFISKRAYNAFKGYAYSQLEKLKKEEYQGYMGEKRKKLVEKYGYDTKYASHLIRLLTTGIEYLSSGRLTLPRPNASKLLEIKNGEWPYNRVVEVAHELLEKMKEVKNESELPDSPNDKLIEEILMSIVIDFHGLKRR